MTVGGLYLLMNSFKDLARRFCSAFTSMGIICPLGQKEDGDKSAREAMIELEAEEQARAAEEAAQKAVQAVEALDDQPENSEE